MPFEVFSVKRPKGWFWAGGYRRPEIELTHRAGEIGDDWLIRPKGYPKCVVTVAEFLTNSNAMRQQVERLGEAKRAEDEARRAKEEALNKAERQRIPSRICPDCSGRMGAIKIVAGGSQVHQPIDFTAHNAQRGPYHYSIHGSVRAYLCDDCDAIRLYGAAPERTSFWR